MSVSTHSLKKEASRLAIVGGFGLAAAACHTEPAPAAPETSTAPPASSTGKELAAEPYRCTVVLGLAVTSEWYRAGFEALVNDDRWQAITKPHTFVNDWADPNHPVWAELPQSPCAEHWKNPDRVLFFTANYKFTTQAEWDAALDAAVATLEQKYPNARRIELLSMVRAPGNASCGSDKGVVSPLVDAALDAASKRHAPRVVLGPRFEAKTCDELEKGGPHFTKAGGAAVAKVVADHYTREGDFVPAAAR